MTDTIGRTAWWNRTLAMGLCGFLVLAVNTQAGILDDFEKDATRVPAPSTPRNPPLSTEPDEDDENCWDLMFESCLTAFCSALWPDRGEPPIGPSSGNKKEPGRFFSPDNTTPREIKPSKELPVFYARLAAGKMTGDVTSWDGWVQGGYKAVAIQYRHTHLSERDPKDYLDVGEAHILYRLAFPYVDVGLGAGFLHLKGNESNGGFSVTVPVRVDVNESWGILWRPVWSEIDSNRVYDQDIGTRISHRALGLEVGYRWLGTHNVRMEGPYLGLSVQIR